MTDNLKNIAASFAEEYQSDAIYPAHLFKALLHKESGLVHFIENTLDKDYYYLHTSGHATAEGITQICNIVKPKMIIPIHGENSHDFDKLNLPYIIKHLKNKKTYNI